MRYKKVRKDKANWDKPIREGNDEFVFGSGCGESSPYYWWLEKHIGASGNDFKEPSELNLDSFSEDDSLYAQDKKAIDTELLELVVKEMGKMTKQQRDVLRMVGMEGRSLAETASLLHISKGAVQNVLKRAINRIKKVSCEKGK